MRVGVSGGKKAYLCLCNMLFACVSLALCVAPVEVVEKSLCCCCLRSSLNTNSLSSHTLGQAEGGAELLS